MNVFNNLRTLLLTPELFVPVKEAVLAIIQNKYAHQHAHDVVLEMDQVWLQSFSGGETLLVDQYRLLAVTGQAGAIIYHVTGTNPPFSRIDELEEVMPKLLEKAVRATKITALLK